MNEIIKITEQNGKKAVSARELHNFLESKRDFSNWIKDRIEKYDLIENVDYEVFNNFGENPNGGRPMTEYALSVDAAKELSMVEGNERGKEARKYFIEAEKKLQSLSVPSYTIEDPIKRAYQWIEEQKEKQRLLLENKKMLPKAEYFDKLVDRNLLTNLRDTAKQIGLSQNVFIKLLLENKFLYRDQKKQLKPYAEYNPSFFKMKDYENHGHAGLQLLVTPEGKETFRLMWGNSVEELS